MLIDRINKVNNFVIYGAQVIAYGAYIAIKKLTGRVPEAFVVTSLTDNPDAIDGIPVIEVKELEKENFIIVAVTELIQKEVIPFLEANGYNDYFVLSQHEEFLLMSEYFRSIGRFNKIKGKGELLEGGENSIVDFAVYEVSNHRDKPLDNHPVLKHHEISIQAGAATTDIVVASVGDNTGINISAKNRQYCEMTASYWVWKNTIHDWKGIEHYRRHMMVDSSFVSDDIDVFLPLPYICYPDTMHQFGRFVSEDVKRVLFDALKTLHPDEYEDYCRILYGPYQYTYNLVVARRQIFDEYCTWFFEITELMEKSGDVISDIRDTRALSYVAEVLTNLYFMYNYDSLKICHVEKEIYC